MGIKNEIKIYQPETVLEAIEELETFLETDLWHAKEDEWETEEDMLKYFDGHFKILKKQVKKIQSHNRNKKGGNKHGI